jgi:hypothetical protein
MDELEFLADVVAEVNRRRPERMTDQADQQHKSWLPCNCGAEPKTDQQQDAGEQAWEKRIRYFGKYLPPDFEASIRADHAAARDAATLRRELEQNWKVSLKMAGELNDLRPRVRELEEALQVLLTACANEGHESPGKYCELCAVAAKTRDFLSSSTKG